MKDMYTFPVLLSPFSGGEIPLGGGGSGGGGGMPG